MRYESETHDQMSCVDSGWKIADNRASEVFTSHISFLTSDILHMNRPPPYFPQNQLSPPDENRYKKFKFVVAGLILVLIAVIVGIGFGIYYLVRLFV